jgi:hypothetical protein
MKTIVATESVLYGSLKQEIFSWKGAADHRGLEPGSREIAIIRSLYQETSSEDTAGWKRLRITCEV